MTLQSPANRSLLSAKLILAITCVLVGLSMGQDLLHAYAKGYNFYWTESMLFSLFWGLFGPVVYYCVRGGVVKGTLRSNWFFRTVIPTALHLILFSLFVYLFSLFLFDHTYWPVRTLLKTTGESLLTCGLVYGGVSYLLPEKKISAPLRTISCRKGGEVVLLKLTEVTSVTSERPYLCVRTETKKHLIDGTLKKMGARLPAGEFARVHRSAIVRIGAIVSLRARGNGDYDLTLEYGDEVRMSRNYRKNLPEYLFGTSAQPDAYSA